MDGDKEGIGKHERGEEHIDLREGEVLGEWLGPRGGRGEQESGAWVADEETNAPPQRCESRCVPHQRGELPRQRREGCEDKRGEWGIGKRQLRAVHGEDLVVVGLAAQGRVPACLVDEEIDVVVPREALAAQQRPGVDGGEEKSCSERQPGEDYHEWES